VLNPESAVVLRLARGGSVLNNDEVAVASGDTLQFEGSLTVLSVGDPPVSGNKFYLFNAPGGFAGAFAATNLPALSAGLGWVTTNLAVDGSIMVTGAVATASTPVFSSVVLSNGSLIMSGTNGTATSSYRVTSATNLSTPRSQWIPIATNNFDSNGNFRFTNAVNPAKSAQFFNISVP
jgi:hypothetical protein